MSRSDAIASTFVLKTHRRSWCTWLANCLLLCLLLAGILVWRVGLPLAERALESLGSGIAVLAAHAGKVTQAALDQTYTAVATDPTVQQVLVEPVTLARFEDVEWLSTTSDQELAFVVAAEGSRSTGKLHCRVLVTDEGVQVKSVDLVTDDQVRHVLVVP